MYHNVLVLEVLLTSKVIVFLRPIKEAEDGPDVNALGNDAAGNWANRKIDYEDVLYSETGNLKETSLSVTGGINPLSFFFSSQYLDEGDIIIINRGYKRASGDVRMLIIE